MLSDFVATSQDEIEIQKIGDTSRDASPVLNCSPAKQKIPGVRSTGDKNGDKSTTLDRFSQ